MELNPNLKKRNDQKSDKREKVQKSALQHSQAHSKSLNTHNIMESLEEIEEDYRNISVSKVQIKRFKQNSVDWRTPQDFESSTYQKEYDYVNEDKLQRSFEPNFTFSQLKNPLQMKQFDYKIENQNVLKSHLSQIQQPTSFQPKIIFDSAENLDNNEYFVVPSNNVSIDQSHDDLTKSNRFSQLAIIKKAISDSFQSQAIEISEKMGIFNLKHLIKFFLYHVFFFFFGPLALIPIIILDSWAMVVNMQFWFCTQLQSSAIISQISWILVVTGNLMMVLKWHDICPDFIKMSNIYDEQIMILDIHIITRAFLIGVRYSFSSQLRLHFLKTKVQDRDFVSKDLFFLSWFYFTPKFVDIEIETAMWRNNVENDFFYFQPYKEVDECMLDKLTDPSYYCGTFSRNQYRTDMKLKVTNDRLYQNNLMNSCTKSQIESQSDSSEIQISKGRKVAPNTKGNKKVSFADQNQSLNCKLLFKEIALGSDAYSPRVMLVGGGFSLLHFMIPFVFRQIEKGSPFGFDTSAIIFTVVELMIHVLFVSTNHLFILAGLIDFKRRMFMSRACASLINPEKLYCDVKFHQYPTFNAAEQETLHTWFNLRQSIMDFGRKYLNRIYVYISTFVIVFSVYAILFFVNIFFFPSSTESSETNLVSESTNITTLANLNGTESNINGTETGSNAAVNLTSVMNAYIFFELTFVLIAVLLMLYCGAVVNAQFDIDKAQLIKIKRSCLFLKLNILKTISKYRNLEDETLKMIVSAFLPPEQHLTLLASQPEQQNLACERIKQQADQIIEVIEGIIEKLEMDSERIPLKIAGVKASYGLIKTILTTIGTIAIASFDKLRG